MRFERVRLAAGEACLPAVRELYGQRLGLPWADVATISVGETVLEFEAGPGEPFYHFAFLVPGDRFDAALEWARARVTLLSDGDGDGDGDGDSVVFDFYAWNARACYFHDPAGNIVELIAHRGIGEAGEQGEFSGSELIGLSELGLVGDLAAMADALRDGLGLQVWDGSATGSLAFVGEQARTLILAGEGRGWMPTGRASEVHPIEVVLAVGASGPKATIELAGGRYRLTGH